MCEGIARAGNGVCLFAVHTESILGKCASLFRAGRTPFLEHVHIDWGIPEENFSLRSVTVNFSTPSSKVHLRPAPVVQQSPAFIKDLHAGSRMNVYAILTLRKTMVPKEVTLRGRLDGGGAEFELTVPIRGIQLADSEPGLPLIHTLAAWRLIQDHQERTAPLALAIGEASEAEIRKASIVRLGERYQIASRHTSFVAVDSGTDARRRVRRARTPSPRPRSTFSSSHSSPASFLRGMITSFFNSPPAAKADEADEVDEADEADGADEADEAEADVISNGADFPGAWPDASTPPNASSDPDNPDGGYGSAETFSTLSSLEGSSDSESDWSDAPPVSAGDARMQRSPSPKLEPLRLAPLPIRDTRRARLQQAAPEPRAPPPPVNPEVVRLASLQLFDGSFDEAIREVVGSQIFDEASVLQVDIAVWATAVSIAFMSKHLADPAQKELLKELLTKAYDFLNDRPDVSARRIIRRAQELV